jgi:hypothetical protein
MFSILKSSNESPNEPSVGTSARQCHRLRSCALEQRRFARVRARLQARAGGHRVEAQGLALSLGALSGLDQEQEPECASREARSRGGLGSMSRAVLQMTQHVW